MNSVSRSPTNTLSNLVQTQQTRYDEARTPTISNCASPKKLPPLFSLGGGGRFENASKVPQYSARNPADCSPSPSNSLSLSCNEARFSSPTDEPIKVERPLLEDTPTCFSPRVASAQPNPAPQRRNTRRSLRKNDCPRTPPLPQNGHDFSLALTIHENLTSISSDAGESAFMASLALQVMPYYITLFCDLVKTGVPWMLLQKALLTLRQRHLMGNETQEHVPLFNHTQPRRGTRNTIRSRNLSFSNAPHLRQGKIQGIPNFGQTCFMNSVLQSLASLEPFLAYLERIHQVRQDRFKGVSSFSTTTMETPLAVTSSPCFAEQLLQLLQAANGLASTADHNNSTHIYLKIDPRPLLRRIGQDHLQFERKGEQQDAQEYLNALMGVVINEAQLDSVTALSDHMRVTETNSRNFPEEAVTAVMAGVERQMEESSFKLDSPTVSRSSTYSGVCADSALSLSCLVERIAEYQEGIKLSPATTSMETAVGSICTSVTTTLEESSSSRNLSSDAIDNRRQLPEEKKQEDYEFTVPFHASEECSEALGRKSRPAISEGRRIQTNRTTSTWSKSSWECQSQSKAMKIFQSTISSITPSPMSGWLGSTIRCCNCQHVRPIRNSPFLDIPLVPSSVPTLLAGAQKKGPSLNSSPYPSCSIEQCLADFTSVERVQDVECRFCSIQSEIVELQEEEMLLRGAIESTEKRYMSKGGDSSTETASLKEDLINIQLQLVKLQTTDPDVDDLLHAEDKSSFENDFRWGEDIARRSSRMVRCDAQKCLFLTRCPSILCCHIQRRYYDPYSNRMEKCVQRVHFEEILDLSPYCAYSSQARISWVAGSMCQSHHSCTKTTGQILYRLESVIEHRGNAHGGHYVCYRRFGKSWFRISDNTVSHISWKEVRNCQAYMLFYEAI